MQTFKEHLPQIILEAGPTGICLWFQLLVGLGWIIHSLGEFKSQPGQPSETLPQNQIETDLELCGPVVEHLPSRREPPGLNTRTECTQIVAIALWSANGKITMWLRSQNALQTTGTPNTTFLLGNPLLTGTFNFLGLCKVIQVLISVDNNSAFFFFLSVELGTWLSSQSAT